MANTDFQKVIKIQISTSYALLTYDYTADDFTLVPTDASFEPISLTEINGDYCLLWNEAVKIVAQLRQLEVVDDVSAIEDILNALESTTDVTFTGSTDTVVFADADDTSNFFYATMASVRTFLNETLNEYTK